MEESLGSVKAAIDLYKGKVLEGNSALIQSSIMKSLEVGILHILHPLSPVSYII